MRRSRTTISSSRSNNRNSVSLLSSLLLSLTICFSSLVSFSDSFIATKTYTYTNTKTNINRHHYHSQKHTGFTTNNHNHNDNNNNINKKSVLLLRNSFLDNVFKNDNNQRQRPTVEKPKDFIQPEPKPLQLSESTDLLRFTKSMISFVLRLGTGTFVLGWKIDSFFYNNNNNEEEEDNELYSLRLGPFSIRDTSSLQLNTKQQNSSPSQQPLVLYEYDSSPYCKRVREMINLLDLTVEYRPCPGARQGKFSDELYEKTGRRTVPYLYDPNTDKGLFESNDQIEYLLENYGPEQEFDRKALWPITFEGFAIYTSSLCAVINGMPGRTRQLNARVDNEDMIPIELWGNEASPFVRPVREKMCSLCLPHLMVSCGRGSMNRDKMIQKTGKQFQVPYLVDPNTGIEMFESEEIVKYLDTVYTI